MYDIEVADNQDCLTIPRERVLEIVRVTLEAEQIASASISIAIVDNPTIHDLNRQYLNHDYETDVLSFLLDATPSEDSDDSDHFDDERDDDAEDDSAPARCSGWTINGEVIVSAEMACDLAPDYGSDPLHELTLYIVHGLLHLCGYDDLTADELPLMRARECAVFELLGLAPPERASDDLGHAGDLGQAGQVTPATAAQSQSSAVTSPVETGGRS